MILAIVLSLARVELLKMHIRNYITVKFNPLGEQEWVATYNGAKNLSDWINDLFVDDLRKYLCNRRSGSEK